MENIFKRKKVDLSNIDNERIFAQYLEIIATNKCNLACEHCMRGDAIDKDISKEVYDAIFEKINFVDDLELGGGEISLNPQLIADLTSSLKKHGTIINNFSLTTNGTVVTDDFIYELKKLKEYVDECNKQDLSIFSRVTPDNFCIVFSTDDYHINEMIKKGYTIETLLENIKKYRQALGDNCVDFKGYSDFEIIDEGRAKNIKNTNVKKYIQKPLSNRFGYTNFNGNNCLITGLLAISADGEVLPCCNLSYENEKVFSAGNIIKRRLSRIFGNMNFSAVEPKKLNKFIKKIYNDAIANKNEYLKYFAYKGRDKNEYFWKNSAPEQGDK